MLNLVDVSVIPLKVIVPNEWTNFLCFYKIAAIVRCDTLPFIQSFGLLITLLVELNLEQERTKL
jgi:hypothetical protein